jgi:hypothetical protein
MFSPVAICSDEEDTFFPIIITHEDVHTGLVTNSFIDMPVVNMATGENITTAMKKIARYYRLLLKNTLACQQQHPP